MNEYQKLIKFSPKNDIIIYSADNIEDKSQIPKLLNVSLLFKPYFFIKLFLFLLLSSYIYFVLFNPNLNINKKQSLIYAIKKNIDDTKNNKKFKDAPVCDNDLDPIHLFNIRLKHDPITICKKGKSKHVCYQNSNNDYYNEIYYYKKGVVCIMENIIINPLKSQQTNIIYKGPVDNKNLGFPILSKGFFNMNCINNKLFEDYNNVYDFYFKSWEYNYKSINEENIEELAPNKTILFLSRNQDSPNLFHGNSEIINAISLMYLFDLNPENIQVIFLESMNLKDDPLYEIYKNLISRGGEPIYIKDLKQKYHISSAIHVPINWDSPCFITSQYPECNNPTKAYKLYLDLIDKYLNIPHFNDSFISDDTIFYYPKSVIKNHKLKTIFNKTVTIQWRKVWPKGRKGQFRILGNGPELADKLASILPKNILIRLVDTANLPMNEQISIMRKTDYLVGIHGAGLSLSIFLPNNSILHEILPTENMKVLTLMSALSGHKTYSDIIDAEINNFGDSENVFFNPDNFTESVFNHMKENDYF